jgi:hypothetical protein
MLAENPFEDYLVGEAGMEPIGLEDTSGIFFGSDVLAGAVFNFVFLGLIIAELATRLRD